MRQHFFYLFMLLISTGLSSQNVGVGTLAPLMKLHVSHTDSAVLLLENTQPLNTNVSNSLYFKTVSGGYPYTGALKTIGTGTNVARLGFFTYASSSPNGLLERMSITDNGNLGIGTTTPAASAQLDVSSTTKGFLPPRMTAAQRTAISSPINGLLVFQTDYPSGLYYFNAGVWSKLSETTSYPNGTATPVQTICCQSWMTKNLDVAFYRNGDPIPQVTDPTAWANLTTGAWCYYNNDPIQGGKFGKLYNWYAVNDPRGLAPEGWHIPTDFDWTTLENCLGGAAVAGGAMKETGTTHWASPNTNATNISGWAGLPGGYRGSGGTFTDVGTSGNWWSSTEYVTNAWYRYLDYDYGGIGRGNSNKRSGFSVRCLRD